MTKLEALLQDVYTALRDQGFHPENDLVAQVHKMIVHEACNDREPLARSLVLTLLQGIPANTDFVVVFRTVKSDIREMHCIMGEEELPGHKDVITVFDTEKEAPRSFRLDRVYRISVG